MKPCAQIAQQFLNSLIARIPTALQTLADQVADRLRNLRIDFGQRLCFFLNAVQQGLVSILALERHFTREQLIQNESNRVKIRAAIGLFAKRLFWRHVQGRTD